ncbi:MAG: hypothetical protein NVSMB2_27940 [Chloroflexota bacterium]
MSMTAELIAALCGVGVMLLGGAVYRLQRRAVTTRRVADLLSELSRLGHVRVAATGLRPSPEWQLAARQLLGQLQTRDTILRAPIAAIACISLFLGLATVSAIWILLAGLAALLTYLLGGSQRRQRRIEIQALDAVTLLASGLRAGYSVPQAIALVARNSPEPTSSEFSMAAQEMAVGVPLADAVAHLSQRTANSDYELVAIIIRVQHEVGGNLAQILDSVGGTLRERLELRRQVSALTAQQRLSSVILTVLPFVLLASLFLADRSFVQPLVTEPIGRGLLVLATVMVLLGWTVMRSVGRVEV